MGNQFSNEDALRSDLPGMSIRIPGTDTQVRLYGFAKLSGYYDLNGRNQTDAPTPQTIPLNDSPADMQGGDFGMTARFSRGRNGHSDADQLGHAGDPHRG